MKFAIRLAGLNIGITSRYPYTYSFCKDYLCADGNVDFTVSVTQEDIAREQEAGERPYPEDYCESICLYRAINHNLTRYDAFVFHASTVAVDGLAYAFAARSGTGKSTHTALWCRHFGERAVVINGDKPILRYENGRFQVYGTPWCGKENLQTNTSAPLHALCFLEQSPTNTIRTLTEPEILDRLFHQALIPANAADADRFLGLMERLMKEVPCSLLGCNISDEAVRVAYAHMKGDPK